MESLGYAAKTAVTSLMDFPPWPLLRPRNVSSGGRKHSRTLMSEPGGSIWGPEMALTASGRLSPAAWLAAHPNVTRFPACLERSPSAQSEWHSRKSGERAKEAVQTSVAKVSRRMPQNWQSRGPGLVQIVKVRTTFQSGDSVCDGAIFQEVLEGGDRHLLSSCFPAPP